jgi:hypothetical protein
MSTTCSATHLRGDRQQLGAPQVPHAYSLQSPSLKATCSNFHGAGHQPKSLRDQCRPSPSRAPTRTHGGIAADLSADRRRLCELRAREGLSGKGPENGRGPLAPDVLRALGFAHAGRADGRTGVTESPRFHHAVLGSGTMRRPCRDTSSQGPSRPTVPEPMMRPHPAGTPGIKLEQNSPIQAQSARGSRLAFPVLRRRRFRQIESPSPGPAPSYTAAPVALGPAKFTGSGQRPPA